MIKSYNDYLEYLEADKVALGRTGKKPSLQDLVWQFEITMRKYEYLINCKNSFIWKGAKMWIKFKYFLLSVLCGFEIPINVFGKGLSIAHKGTIVINGSTRIGENCRLHVCVNIGTIPGCSGVAPVLGDNVYIAPGVKIYGKVQIASGIMIGANSVVNKSFTEENITIAGSPAKKISDLGRFEIEKRNKEKEQMLFF